MVSPQIFRKKSMDRVASPEQLNDYIRVSNPGVWMVLAAVIVLLMGICVWGIFGRLDSKLPVVVQARDGNVSCLIREEDMASVTSGMTVSVDGSVLILGELPAVPVLLTEQEDPYLMHLGELEVGSWVYVVPVQLKLTDGNWISSAASELADGVYKAWIVSEQVAPVSFIMN